MIRIRVFGLSGKMGQELRTASQLPIYSARLRLTEDEHPDLWVEFSSPGGALDLCRKIAAAERSCPLLIGSTGWTDEQSKELENFAQQFPILRASNFAFGIQLCRFTLKYWNEFPELKSWKVSIKETHHRDKKDSPSGTALTLREVIGGEALITSVREGNTVGVHEVVFSSESETLTLIHEAKRRSVFAEGALDAAIRLTAVAPLLPKRLLKLDDLYLQREA